MSPATEVDCAAAILIDGISMLGTLALIGFCQVSLNVVSHQNAQFHQSSLLSFHVEGAAKSLCGGPMLHSQ
jgi:hypothetical protein